MNKVKLLIIIVVLGTLVTVGSRFLDNGSSGESTGKAAANQPGKQKMPPRVRVEPATRSNIVQTLEITGTVEPHRIARLASPAEGPVADLLIRESDRVNQGEPLIAIGRKKGVDAQIVSLREELKKEEDNLNRIRQLVDSQALPGEQLDQARTAYERVRAMLIKAEETAQDYIIRAPWAGVVSRVNVKEGEFIAPRAIVVEIYDPASLITRASIPEIHAADISAGMNVEVALDAYPDTTIPGRIERVYPYLDSRLRTRTVEIILDQSVRLLPGMFARLVLSLKRADSVLVVPLEALVTTPKGRMLFVAENGKAMARSIKTGIEANNRIQIISGIQPGDKIIVAGNEKLKDGVPIRPVGEMESGSGDLKKTTELQGKQTGRGSSEQ
ncbi:MAG: efflux RND transporter periplasmic adaptor subunit [Candidatus Delongbacteria bacterium]|nr:efflux RND transporter periplasmic adaptor subunit [Candidatus Delongbacteria bacterium]